jgi:excinuclease ABC subunit C
MRYALKTVRDIFMIRSCSLNLTEENIKNKKFKVCLDYHIHKCEGPCEGYQSQEDYNEMINQVAKLLNGKTTSLIKEMTNRMDELSGDMMFEQAGKMRDKIEALKVYSSKQKMIGEEIIDRDIFAIEREDNDGCGMILKIRDGKVIGKSHYYINNIVDKPDEEILENLLTNYYTKTEFIPEEIFLENELEEKDVLKTWLENKRQGKVEIIVPKIGDKAKLVAMVKANAKLMLEELKLAKLKREFIAPSLDALKRDLKLDKLPRRIECYDISHIQGTDTVASMISFFDAKPRKSEYRKYKIQTVLNEAGHPDDFLSMREVIYRRFKRAIEENQTLPDLVVIDGGKGQLSSAVKVLDDIGIKIINRINPEENENISGMYIIGLAKRLEEIYFPEDPDPHTIPKTSSGLKLLQKVRDEAHRFAVTFHRSLRDKRTLTTELLEINGIGEKTANKLLKEFGSVEAIKEKLNTEFEAIEKTIGKKTAEKLKEHFLYK